MAILQSPIRCHKNYKTHVFLPSPALQGKLLGFHCTQVHDLWSSSKYRPTLGSWTSPSPPAPSPTVHRTETLQRPGHSSWAQSHLYIKGTGQLLSRDTESEPKQALLDPCQPNTEAGRAPCSELLELGSWHGAIPGLHRTRTQPKPPAEAKLALCTGSGTHLCPSLQRIPEWTRHPGYCITHQLMASWWEPEKLVGSCYKGRLQKRRATSSWTQRYWCLSGMGIPPVTCSFSNVHLQNFFFFFFQVVSTWHPWRAKPPQ